MGQNLAVLVDSGRYLQLSEKSIANALASNSLDGFSELELYHIAKGWLEHDPPSRHSSVYALMRHIRFPLMSPNELIQISQDEEEKGQSMMRSDTACVNLLLEASNYQMMPYMQPALQTERTQIRSDATHILALGGVMRQQLVVSRELRLYDENTGHWRALRPMEVPRYQHGVALLGGFLFIVGGKSTHEAISQTLIIIQLNSLSILYIKCKNLIKFLGQSTYDTKGKTAIDSAYRYDPRFDKWLQIASLNEKRTFFHLSALNGKLFAVGGRNASGEIGTLEKNPLFKMFEIARSACPVVDVHHLPLILVRHGGVLQLEEKRVDLCDQHGGASLWACWDSSWGPHVHLR